MSRKKKKNNYKDDPDWILQDNKSDVDDDDDDYNDDEIYESKKYNKEEDSKKKGKKTKIKKNNKKRKRYSYSHYNYKKSSDSLSDDDHILDDEDDDDDDNERQRNRKRRKRRRKKRKEHGNWTNEEDRRLIELVNNKKNLKEGKGKWTLIAEKLTKQMKGKYGKNGTSFGKIRYGKQCRERWINHLDPKLKQNWWEPFEEKIIIEFQRMHGNRWSKMSKLLKGRSPNGIKNHWHSTLKRLTQIGEETIDSEGYFYVLLPAGRGKHHKSCKTNNSYLKATKIKCRGKNFTQNDREKYAMAFVNEKDKKNNRSNIKRRKSKRFEDEGEIDLSDEEDDNNNYEEEEEKEEEEVENEDKYLFDDDNEEEEEKEEEVDKKQKDNYEMFIDMCDQNDSKETYDKEQFFKQDINFLKNDELLLEQLLNSEGNGLLTLRDNQMNFNEGIFKKGRQKNVFLNWKFIINGILPKKVLIHGGERMNIFFDVLPVDKTKKDTVLNEENLSIKSIEIHGYGKALVDRIIRLSDFRYSRLFENECGWDKVKNSKYFIGFYSPEFHSDGIKDLYYKLSINDQKVYSKLSINIIDPVDSYF